jgi:hypothetical protein
MELTPQMSATLQEIIDHHEIRKVLSVYCHGCDRADGPRMASVYLEDSWDDHGPFKGPGQGLVERVMNNFVRGIRCIHLLGQSLINVRGDEAGAETYFLATIGEKGENGEEAVTLLGGRYVDTLLRDDGQWKIKNRICVRDWSRTLDTQKDRLEGLDFVQGELSGQDPSYAILGLTHAGLR